MTNRRSRPLKSRYADRFRDEVVAREYEDAVYAPGTWDSFVWELERPHLIALARRLGASRSGSRYLDFATGTGRILATLEPYVDHAAGVDVSKEMLRLAGRRLRSSTRLIVADILTSPEMVGYDFDLVTAFRFFVNCEPEQRSRILTALALRLRDGDSRLVFNVHRNAWSLDGVIDRRAQRSRWNRHVMSPRAARILIADAGLQLVESWGLALLPGAGRRLRPLQGFARSLDRLTARRPGMRWIGRELVFVCRRPGP